MPTIIPLEKDSYMQFVFSENEKDIAIVIQYEDIPDAAMDALNKFCEEND